MAIYWIEFTNGDDRRGVVVAQPDIIFAAMKARTLAPEILQLPAIRCRDPVKWRIVIQTDHEGRLEEPFPTPH
jgi:hypothetical protein